MYKGSLVALITPFDKQFEIDEKALKELIEWHIQEGSDGLVIAGTTGEGIVLSPEEREKILKIAVDVSYKRIPIIMGTGCSDTRASIMKTKRAKELGADGCLVVVPYYNKPTERGCFQHFYEISKIGLPLIVYHHPGRTGVRLSSQFLSELSTLPNIIGIKEASGEVHLTEDILSKCHATIFSGDDILTQTLIQKGAAGVISVVGNLIPRAWKVFVDSLLNQEYEKASLLQKKFEELNKAIMLEVNPQGIKYALSLVHRCQPYVRLPLVMPREEAQASIKMAMQKLSLL